MQKSFCDICKEEAEQMSRLRLSYWDAKKREYVTLNKEVCDGCNSKIIDDVMKIFKKMGLKK